MTGGMGVMAGVVYYFFFVLVLWFRSYFVAYGRKSIIRTFHVLFKTAFKRAVFSRRNSLENFRILNVFIESLIGFFSYFFYSYTKLASIIGAICKIVFSICLVL